MLVSDPPQTAASLHRVDVFLKPIQRTLRNSQIAVVFGKSVLSYFRPRLTNASGQLSHRRSFGHA